jgi:hypothetical protein
METRVNTMPANLKETITAFISGNVCTMGFTFLKIPTEFMGIGWKILATIMVGVAGGVAGVAGKDLYGALKRKIFVKHKKQAP